MSCCGQRRDAMRTQLGVAAGSAKASAGVTASSAVVRPAAFATLTNRGESKGVALQYRERARIQVRGPVTGRTYWFDAVKPVVVDVHDADVLLRSRWFQRSATHFGQ